MDSADGYIPAIGGSMTISRRHAKPYRHRPEQDHRRPELDRKVGVVRVQSHEGESVKTLLGSLIVAFAFVGAPGYAQDRSADMNMQILRDKIKADKKVVVAANMQLTDAEAKAFWPIYDQYQNDLKKINERLGNAILMYVDAYKAGPIADGTAKKLLDESIAIDDAEAKLRKDYAAKLIGAIPATKVARYLQIESKIRAAIRYELAAQIPLVE
jgi:hypothetical protein